MDSDDDVDIIFENSVLHKALQETGMDKVETESRSVARPGRKKKGIQERTDDRFIKKLADLFSLIWKPSKWRILLPSILFTRSSVENINLTYQNRTMKRLIGSPLLSEDDLTFLDLYISPENRTAVASNAINKNRRHIPKWSMCAFSVLVLLFGSIQAFYMSNGSDQLPSIPNIPGFSSLPYTVGLFTYFSLLAVVPYFLLVFSMKSYNSTKERLWSKIVIKDLREANADLETFENASLELIKLTKKCMRYIRESELVAKGYLAARPLSHSGDLLFLSDPHRWCPRLRHLLFDGSSKIVKGIKETVTKIHNSIPLTPDFEALDDSYLLSKPDPDTSDDSPVKEEAEPRDRDQEEIEIVNNIIPTPKLKALVNLFEMHLSYFIRGLAICLYKEKLEGSKRPAFYSTVAKCVLPLRDEMDKLFVNLQEHHEFYRTSDTAVEKNSNAQMFSRKSKGPLQNLHKSVNSLDIRLHSVKDRVQRFRSLLENKVEEEDQRLGGQDNEKEAGNRGKILPDDIAAFEDVLRHIRIDLDLCIGSCEESRRAIRPRVKQESHQVPSDHPTGKEVVTVSGERAPPRIIPLVDPEPCDQVWEDVTESGYDESTEGATSHRRFTREDMEQMRQRKEDATMFMNELKGVLELKHIEVKGKEELALARYRAKLAAAKVKSSQENNGTNPALTLQNEQELDFSKLPAAYAHSVPMCSETFADRYRLAYHQPIDGNSTTSFPNGESAEGYPSHTSSQIMPPNASTRSWTLGDSNIRVMPQMTLRPTESHITNGYSTHSQERATRGTDSQSNGSMLSSHENDTNGDLTGGELLESPASNGHVNSYGNGTSSSNSQASGTVETVSQKEKIEAASQGALAASSAARSIENHDYLREGENGTTTQKMRPEVSSPAGYHSAESYSLLALKLESADPPKSDEGDMRELLPGAQQKAEALNASRTLHHSVPLEGESPSRDGCWQSSLRRSKTPPPQPFAEGWQSSVQKSKDKHWSSCLKLLEECGGNPQKDSSDNGSEGCPSESKKNGMNNSSFFEISMDEEYMILLPPALEDPTTSSSAKATSGPSDPNSSQINIPATVDPKGEKFQRMDGEWVSRHHFATDGRTEVLERALKDLEDSERYCDDESRRRLLTEEGNEQTPTNPNPNRRRHKAERAGGKASNNWVNITHLEVTSQGGSQFSIIREKDVTNRDLQLCQKMPSPYPSSSFNTSLALMAASRAHSFNTFTEEHYTDDGDGVDTNYQDGATGGHSDNRIIGGAVGGGEDRT